MKLVKFKNNLQEPFVQTCVNFLKRRCPQLVGGPPKDDQQQIKSQMLPPETIGTMLGCLQQCARYSFL